MNNTFYFLRHGQTKRDSGVPISKWTLSDKGEEQAKKLAQEGVFDDVDIIVSDKLGLDIVQAEEISELNRDKGGFMEPYKYEESVKACLENLDNSVDSWETAAHALNRFSAKIDELDRNYEAKKILVVGHGFTINLYFAKLLGVLDEVYKRFSTNSYADWGVVKNDAVLKDIAK